MKIQRIALFLGLGLLLASACSKAEIETITADNPDGTKTITVRGEQEMPGDPIKVTIDFKVPGGTEQGIFEFQAGSMTKENVKIEWEDNTLGTISFEMDDGETWWVDFICQDSMVQAIKRLEP